MTEKYKKSRHAQKGWAIFANDCSGATAIEYALIAAGISIAIVATVNNVGSQVAVLFTSVAGIF